MASRGKLRWGDTLDDEDLLPPSVTKGPDDNGIKTVIEYYKNEKGDALKKTTKIKVVTVEKKVYKVGMEPSDPAEYRSKFWRARAAGAMVEAALGSGPPCGDGPEPARSLRAGLRGAP